MIIRSSTRKAIFLWLLLLIRLSLRLLDFRGCLVLLLFLLVLVLFGRLFGRLSWLWLIFLWCGFLIFSLWLKLSLRFEHLRSLLERDRIVDDLTIDSSRRAASASTARASSASATRFATATGAARSSDSKWSWLTIYMVYGSANNSTFLDVRNDNLWILNNSCGQLVNTLSTSLLHRNVCFDNMTSLNRNINDTASLYRYFNYSASLDRNLSHNTASFIRNLSDNTMVHRVSATFPCKICLVFTFTIRAA